ncbi:efflux RND transporter periplasmic adaptor subunit, partial [Burkholderia territorii]
SLILEDGKTYSEAGKLQFSDVTVDQATGSVTIRAVFPNPGRVLLPGMFVRARIEEGVNENAFLVPQIGVTHDQKGQPVSLIVNAHDKVETRQLKTTGMQGQNWIVEGGLQAGDRVIVQGVDKVRPGATVKSVAAQLPAANAASGAAAVSAAPAAVGSGAAAASGGAPASAAAASSAQ